jgi:hypothetical protein
VGSFGGEEGAGLPLLLGRTSAALSAQALRGTSFETRPERILVVIELAGGNDGLNMIVPFADAAYYRARPTLAIAERDVIRIADGFGLHPSLVGFERLYKDGLLAVVHGCSYPRPSLSHFSSMGFWHTAVPNGGESLGWLGRVADAGYDAATRNLIVNMVAVMMFTEFGRRVEENGSQGTDHGTATPMFIVGTNLKMTTDFRQVYATMIQEWLGCDAEPILGGETLHAWPTILYRNGNQMIAVELTTEPGVKLSAPRVALRATVRVRRRHHDSQLRRLARRTAVRHGQGRDDCTPPVRRAELGVRSGPPRGVGRPITGRAPEPHRGRGGDSEGPVRSRLRVCVTSEGPIRLN